MDLRGSVANQTSFSLRLSRNVSSAAAGDCNLALSPLSLHAILSLLAAGSAGPTLAQILSAVGSPSVAGLRSLSSWSVGSVLADGSSAGGPRVAFANGLWVDSSVSLKKGFEEIVTSEYKAEAKAVDFQSQADEARKQINSWADNATNGLVKELLPSEALDSSTVLLLCNALYFKGAWEKKFDASMTKHSKFYQLNGSSVRVPFMSSREKQFISCYNGFSVLKLPYERGADSRQFSMYIILPDERDGIWNLSEVLSSEPGFLDRYRPWEKVPVREFKIPRFKISFELEASEVLKGMGMVLPFSMKEADLTEMVDCSKVFRGGYNLYVSKIFHKSVIEVTEEGTEASAATAAVVCVFGSARSSPPPPVDFVADHPFIFVITEDLTGVLLFTGHVLNPSLAG